VNDFETVSLEGAPQVVAPDGSDVRILPNLAGGSMAHFTLALGATSRAVVHRTVEEIWFVVSGRGDMWRATAEREETVALQPGVALTIPVGTRFQFRATGREPLTIVGVTMPPWPGADEAVAVDGPWEPTA
jgi:mannose-6-phosphate isomerase-like protein (cupin superfamily)